MKRTLLKSMLLAGMLAAGMGMQAKEDVTVMYVMNADLSIDPNVEGNGWTLLNGWRQDFQAAQDDEHVNVVEFYAGWGSLEKTEYGMTQTISLPAGDYRLAVNAFYRHGNDGDGTNKDKAYIFAGEKKQNVYALKDFYGICNEKGYTGDSDLWKASNGFYKGDFSNAFDFTMETAGDIEIGFQGTFDIARSWVILGPVKLYQYTVDDYIADYNEKVAEAEALYNEPMSASVLAALKAAVKDASSFADVKAVTEAIQALNEAIVNANNSIATYNSILAVIETFRELDPALDLSSMENAYFDGTLESAEELYPIFQKLEIASLGTGADTDYTKAIINPSFEFNGGSTFGWTYTTSDDHGAKENSNATYTVDNADGDYVFNIWQTGNAITQTIEGLPDGLYMLRAIIATDAGSKVNLITNDERTPIDASADGKGVGVDGVALTNVSGGTLTIGAEGVDGHWYKVDNFRLIYQPNTSGIVDEKVAEVSPLLDEMMAASAKTALQEAINNANSGDVMAGLQALSEAATAARASIKLYEDIRANIDLLQADDPDLDLSEIEEYFSDGKYEAVEDLYPLIQKQKIASLGTDPNTDYTSAIINPSFEFNYGSTFGWTYTPSSDYGAKANSNATYTINNADGDYVFNIWWSGNAISQTIVGLPNGEYELTALIASDAYTDGNTMEQRNQVTVFANDERVAVMTSEDGKGTGVDGTVSVTITDGTLTIGAEGCLITNDDGSTSYYWYKVDNFRLVLKNATAVGIEDVAAGTKPVKASTVYNTQGQRVTKATKGGVYVVNGKKYVAK